MPDLVGQVRAHLPAGLPAWLVGGAVRDALLRRPVRDFDFVVGGDALAGARSVANALGAAFYPLDAERGVGRVVLARDDGRITLDISSLRGPDLLADLTARDFTLNALAVDLARPADLIDPLHGERDLRTKLIRACSPTAIADDPLRAIRAVRLAAELRFRIDKPTLAAVRAQAHALASVSSERRRDELLRCLGGPRPAAAIRSLDLLGLLPALIPELPALHGVTQSPPHVYDVWEHTLTVLDRLMEVLAALDPVYNIDAVSDVTLGLASLRLGRHRQALGQHLAATLNSDHPVRTLLLLASLLHDIGKPATRSVEPSGAHSLLQSRPGWGAPGAGAAHRAALQHRRGGAHRRHRRQPFAPAQPGRRNRGHAARHLPLFSPDGPSWHRRGFAVAGRFLGHVWRPPAANG